MSSLPPLKNLSVYPETVIGIPKENRKNNQKEFITQIIKLVKTTGNEVLKYHKKKDLLVSQKGSGMNDMFSQADMLSHELLTKGLGELGATQILSEESMHESFDRSKEVWIIDPIDGTKAFISGGNEFSILVSRYRNGRIDLGVAYFPALGELYYAQVGTGCWLQDMDENIYQIKNHDTIANDFYKVQLRPERSKEEKEMKALYTYVENNNLEVSYVVFGYDTRNVLAGSIDYFIESYPKLGKRDIGPSQIFIQEAGFHMSDIEGNSIDFSQESCIYNIPIIVGKKGVCKEVLEELKSLAFSPG